MGGRVGGRLARKAGSFETLSSPPLPSYLQMSGMKICNVSSFETLGENWVPSANEKKNAK